MPYTWETLFLHIISDHLLSFKKKSKIIGLYQQTTTMPKHSSKATTTGSMVTNYNGDESSSRGRVKSIDRLIGTFFEIVGLDDFSHELSDRGSGANNKNDNVLSSRHSIVTSIDTSWSCNVPETIEKIDLDSSNRIKQKKEDNELFKVPQSKHRGTFKKPLQKLSASIDTDRTVPLPVDNKARNMTFPHGKNGRRTLRDKKLPKANPVGTTDQGTISRNKFLFSNFIKRHTKSKGTSL
jgi:hypothetical protein